MHKIKILLSNLDKIKVAVVECQVYQVWIML